MSALNHFFDIFLVFNVPNTAIELAHSPGEWCFCSQITMPCLDKFVVFTYLYSSASHTYIHQLMLSYIKSSTTNIHLNMKHHPLKSVYLASEAILRARSSSFVFLNFNWRQSFPQFLGLSSLLKASFAGSQRPFPLVDLLKYFTAYIKWTINFPISPYECFTSPSHRYSEYPQCFCRVIWRKWYDVYIAEYSLYTTFTTKLYITFSQRQQVAFGNPYI